MVMNRKKYEKPAIVVENFVLSQCIAACAQIVESADINCIKEEGDIVTDAGGFVDKFKCDINVESSDSPWNETYCYHTLEGFNIMNS